MRNKFDIEIKKEFKDSTNIDYGIIKGNDKIVFIKAGQDGSLYGYENKYLRMADRLNKNYNCSVICSSNPFDGNNPLDNAMEVIEEYASKFNDYDIYYLGYSNGGLIGLWFGTQYNKMKKIISINAPLMYNYHITKKGITDFNGDKIVLVYGEYDQSINYVPLLENIFQPKLTIEIIEGEDHYISKDTEHFFKIPEKHFFKEGSEKNERINENNK